MVRERLRGGYPSPEEAMQEHRSELRSRGCQVCGHDDPDDLTMVPTRHFQTCPAGQSPGDVDPEEVVLCDEHHRPGNVLQRAKMLQHARHNGATHLVKYDCGAVVHLTDDRHPARRRGRAMGPEGPVRCACGADIQEIIDIPTNPNQPDFDHPPNGVQRPETHD